MCYGIAVSNQTAFTARALTPTECESLITVLNGIHHGERSIQYEQTHNNVQSKFLIWYAGGEDIEHHSLIRTSCCTKLSMYHDFRKQGDHKSSLITFPFVQTNHYPLSSQMASINEPPQAFLCLSPSAHTGFCQSASSDAENKLVMGAFVWDPI